MGNSNSHSESDSESVSGSSDQQRQGNRRRHGHGPSTSTPITAAPAIPTGAASIAAQLSDNEAFQQCLRSLGVNLESLNLQQLIKDNEEESTRERGDGDGEENFEVVEMPPPPAPGLGPAVHVPKSSKNKALKLVSAGDIKDVEEIGIGVGVFGKAFKGVLQDKGNDKKSMNVAVKLFLVPLSLKKGNAQLGKLTEMKHRNVVSMIGVVLDNNFLAGPKGPRVLMDYYPEGNLLNYLSKKENPQDYAMLGKLALDIINGCKYLHERNVVHGNLAARNILIQRSLSKHKIHFNAKVSDYGIAQLALGTSSYRVEPPINQNSTTKMVDPVRWMPKELAECVTGTGRMIFTKQADVWAFGVVLWEMWTKGATPWGSFCRDEFKKFLIQDGKSPLNIHRPHGCPEHIIGVMETIFKGNPNDRPSFDMLLECFTKFRAHGIENKPKGQNQGQGQGGEDGKKKKYQAPQPPPQFSSGAEGGKKENKNQQNEGQGQGKKKQFEKPQPQNFKKGNQKPQHQQQKRQFTGPHQSQNPGAPPPYTPTPQPMPMPSSYTQFPPSQPPAATLETEIQRRERELHLLKTQHLQVEFIKKQKEMDDIVRKMAQTSMAAGAGDAGVVLPPGGIPVDPYAFSAPPPPPPYQGHEGARGGGGGGSGGRGHRGGRGGGGGQKYRGRGGGGGGPGGGGGKKGNMAGVGGGK